MKAQIQKVIAELRTAAKLANIFSKQEGPSEISRAYNVGYRDALTVVADQLESLSQKEGVDESTD